MSIKRVSLILEYQGVDISPDIEPDLLSFDYIDKESGEADEISVTLKDNNNLWHGDWLPGKGDRIKATIFDEGIGQLYCGLYEIDDLNFSGPPSVFTIKGVSVPLARTLRRTKKSRVWEEVKLSEIVTAIADEGGINPIFDVNADPAYSKQIQREESDLSFLNRLCEAEGFSLKVTDSQLVVFDQKLYEEKAVVATITKGQSNIERFRFQSQAFDLYKSCTVRYYNEDDEEEISQTFTAPNVEEGMELELTKVASSYAEAARWAKAELRRRNKNEMTGDLTLTGDINMIAGVTIDLNGFGKFSGKYIIETARHNKGASYTTNIKVRRVLEGY